MKKIALILCTGLSVVAYSQNTKGKTETKLVNKYESKQPQDFSVPPPPVNTFPAQFPQGNKTFIKMVEQNLNQEALASLPKGLHTEIIVKVDDEGNVINVSTYGKNETFNNEVKAAAIKSNGKTKWTVGKNNRGEKVVDIVRLPFRYKK